MFLNWELVPEGLSGGNTPMQSLELGSENFVRTNTPIGA